MVDFLDITVRVNSLGQARAAITIIGLADILIENDEQGQPQIISANKDAAVDIWENPILSFGEYETNPEDPGGEPIEIVAPVFDTQMHLRMRFVTELVKQSAQAAILDDPGSLPPGFEVITPPGTRKWFGDP